jgi:hypothetical protein
MKTEVGKRNYVAKNFRDISIPARRAICLTSKLNYSCHNSRQNML